MTTNNKTPLDWKLVDVHQGTREAEMGNGHHAICTPGWVGVRLTVQRIDENYEATTIHEQYYDTMLKAQDVAEKMAGGA